MAFDVMTGHPARPQSHARVASAPALAAAQAPLPQSGMGITSFFIAVLGVLSSAMMVIVILSVARSDPHARDEGTPLSYLVGTWIVGDIVLCVCGIVFGIGGIRQQNRRHQLAWVGLIANIFLPLSILFLMLLAVTFYGSSGIDGAPRPPLGPPDPADWSSAPARLFRWATAALGCLIIFYRMNRRSRRLAQASMPFAPSIPCGRCRKPMPTTAGFCRRCGAAMN